MYNTSNLSNSSNNAYYEKFLSLFGYNKSNIAKPISSESMWVPDVLAQSCYSCHKPFTFILRRHHCRICGNVFCKDCSEKVVEGKYWGSQKQIKVCEHCYWMYKKLDETLIDTIIENKVNLIEDIDSIDDNIKNLKRETKLSEYCKKYKKENEDCYKYLQLKDKKKEETIKKDIDYIYENILSNYIEITLNNDLQNPKLYKHWFELLFDLVKKAMNRISPSFRDWKDSLNITEYIKIKTIEYKDQSLSRLIDGYAFHKNVSSKKMRTFAESPKILLLDCGWDCWNYDFDNSTQMTTVPAYIENIRKKIELLEVNLILINKGISFQLQQEFLQNNKISLAINVKSKSLKQIARCTKTYALPSIDLIDKETIWGQCKNFKIDKINNKFLMKNKNNQNAKLINGDYNWMIFEGCDNILFQTIIWSGTNLNELKAVKNLLKFSILITARDFFIQKSLLYFMYCDIPKMVPTAGCSSNNILVHSDLLNQDKSPIIGHSSSKGKNTQFFLFDKKSHSVNTEDPGWKIGFDVQTLFYNLSEITFLKLRMCIGSNKVYMGADTGTNAGNANWPLPQGWNASMIITDFTIYNNEMNGNDVSDSNLNICNEAYTVHSGNNGNYKEDSSGIPVNNNASTSTTQLNAMLNYSSVTLPKPQIYKESEILKMINFSCGEPEKLRLVYYSTDEKYDKPWGRWIIDICNEKDQKCEKCKHIKYQHFYYLYPSIPPTSLNHTKSSRIKIFLPQSQSDFKLNLVQEYINRENSSDFSKYNNYGSNPTNANTFSSAGNTDYWSDIYTYGYCSICQDIVTPLAKIQRNIYNMSSAKFFKIWLFSTNIKNRSDQSTFNWTNYFGKNTCNHSSFKDLVRVFVSKFGSVIFKHDIYPKYSIDSNTYGSTDSLTKELFQHYTTSDMGKLTEVIEALKANFTFANEEIQVIIDVYSENKIQNTKILKLVDMLIKGIDKVRDSFPSLQDWIGWVLTYKFENYPKSLAYLKKLYFRICQVKVLYNKIRNKIQKLKYFLALELYLVKEYSLCKLQSDTEPSASVPWNNNTGNNNQTGGGTSTNTLPIWIQVIYSKYSSFFPSFKYIEIDNWISYQQILSEISFYDEQHANYSSIINENDLSTIVSYTLTSDKYRVHLHSNTTKIKILDMKCQHKSSPSQSIIKGDINLVNTLSNSSGSGYSPYQASDVNAFNKSDNNNANYNVTNMSETNKFMYNYFSWPNQFENLLFDTSLLFDSTKQTYHSYETSNINQQWENELLGDDKNHFTIQFKNINSKSFTRFIERRGTVSSKQTITITASPSAQDKPKPKVRTNLEVMDDKWINFEDEVKAVIEDINAISKEFIEWQSGYNAPTPFKIPKLCFIEDKIPKTECEVIVYYPRQFEAWRLAYCASYQDLITSLMKSNVWSDVSGGKSKASFFKSVDNKLIFKSVNKNEFKMFIEAACQYFHHNAKFLFHRMPSALAKMWGAFKIKMKKTEKNQTTTDNYYLLWMENLFNSSENEGKTGKAYDWKGSVINRYICKKGNLGNQVGLDSNFKEDFNGEPIVLDKNIFELWYAAVHNDSLILSKMNVIDYSLLVIFIEDEDRKILRLGIIDYIRNYTWDKQWEHVGKIIFNGLNTPTIISPNDYRDRFKSAICSYFIGI